MAVEDSPADDVARVEKTHIKLLGVTVTRLLEIKARLSGPEVRFLEALDLQMNVLGRMPGAENVKRLKDLAWRMRRAMPAHLAPKLPPHDPIVQQMEQE